MVSKYEGGYSYIPEIINLIKEGDEKEEIELLEKVMTSDAELDIKKNIIEDLKSKTAKPGIQKVVDQFQKIVDKFKEIKTSKPDSPYSTYEDIAAEAPGHYARYPAEISPSNPPPGGMPLYQSYSPQKSDERKPIEGMKQLERAASPPGRSVEPEKKESAEKQTEPQFINAVKNSRHYKDKAPTEAEKKSMKVGDYLIYPDVDNKYHIYGIASQFKSKNYIFTADFNLNKQTKEIELNYTYMQNSTFQPIKCNNLEQMFSIMKFNEPLSDLFKDVGPRISPSKPEEKPPEKLKEPERAVSPFQAKRAASPSPASAAEPEKKVLAEKQNENQFIHDVKHRNYINHEPTKDVKKNMEYGEYVIYPDKKDGIYHIYGMLNAPVSIDFRFNKETKEIEYNSSYGRNSSYPPFGYKCNNLKQLFADEIKRSRNPAMFTTLFGKDL